MDIIPGERAIALSEGENSTPCPLTSIMVLESNRTELEQLVRVGLYPAPLYSRDFNKETRGEETTVASFALGVSFQENVMLVAATLPESVAFGSVSATSKNELVQRHQSALDAFGFEDTAFRGQVEFTKWNHQPTSSGATSQYGYGYTSASNDGCCDSCTLLWFYMICCTDYGVCVFSVRRDWV
tara:strand:- start:165 stop:716 length:552 start_codon:yes stop_codon:yes gene_type:complete